MNFSTANVSHAYYFVLYVYNIQITGVIFTLIIDSNGRLKDGPISW